MACSHSFIAGHNAVATHRGCVIIGKGLKSTKDFDVQVCNTESMDQIISEFEISRISRDPKWKKARDLSSNGGKAAWREETLRDITGMIEWHQSNNPNFEEAVDALKILYSHILLR